MEKSGRLSFVTSLEIESISHETNKHLKIDLWKRKFLLETTIFKCYVSFREGIFLLEVPTLPETNSSHLKMDGWKSSSLLEWHIFRGHVSFREGMSGTSPWKTTIFWVFFKNFSQASNKQIQVV